MNNYSTESLILFDKFSLDSLTYLLKIDNIVFTAWDLKPNWKD